MSRTQSVAQWTRQVALHAWPDDGDELAHRGVRNGRNTNDVAAKNQATHLSAGERSTQFGAIGNDQVAQCGEDSAPKEFTEKSGRVIVRHTGTDKGGESSSTLGVAFPHAQDASNEFLAGVVRIVAEIAKDYGRVDGPLQRGGEELVLGSEVVMHQRRIDLCLAGDGPDGGAVETLPGKQIAGGGQNRLSGIGAAVRTSTELGHYSPRVGVSRANTIMRSSIVAGTDSTWATSPADESTALTSSGSESATRTSLPANMTGSPA